MTGETLVKSLRSVIAEQKRQIDDLTRHNKELREAIAALLGPPGPDGASQITQK